MKFDASRTETEKTVKLERCQTLESGDVSCTTAVMINGRSFEVRVGFLARQGSPPETGKLSSLFAEFGKDDFPFVKAAFVKMSGPPHQSSNPVAKEEPAAEFLSWQGNKAAIRLSVFRQRGMFVIEPNFLSRGCKFESEATLVAGPALSDIVTPTPLLANANSQGNGPSVYPSDTWTTTIRLAAPNSPVYMIAEMRNGTGKPVGATCWVSPWNRMAPVGNSQPACLMGYTDSDGFFSFSGSYSAVAPNPGNWSELWYVGGQQDANVIGAFKWSLVPEGSQLANSAPIRLTMLDGTVKEFPRPAPIKVSLASLTHTQMESGKFRYDLVLDGSEADTIRVGDGFGNDSETIEENGWGRAGTTWFAIPGAQRSDNLHFNIESNWLPGPIAVIFEGSKTPIGMTPNSIDIATMVRATSNFRIQRVLIGPAIEPSGTRKTLVDVIKEWMSDLNLGFLKPLTVPGVDLDRVVDTLEPQTEFERTVVECLRTALAQTVQE